jgi:hypothetical protein
MVMVSEKCEGALGQLRALEQAAVVTVLLQCYYRVTTIPSAGSTLSNRRRLLQCSYRALTVLLQWQYCNVTVMLQWCYSTLGQLHALEQAAVVTDEGAHGTLG